ncbi:molybdopterin-dependent oxidoreductase [Paenibacillus sp. SYP-B3998]|uniref:Molybdopterin-dependent oxidoreductase n=1 Tax=Paenibacillus sp. SYP-B3998 TaxID=2678564 RepID=A0A6G4A7C3_9BACL|nr:molybdopterin-dependent oxidoreductase [Paenibacillus sp. SYP-B3998]NEW09844.1 molybdopterin-dependent oxidoreductase [Paenibacillus sp. SYP-B3998]
MNSKRGWLKQSFGKRLNRIHSWNAWILLLLTATGIVLSFGAIRGDLGIFRVSLKQLHIYLGVASVLLIILYTPMIRKHWHQIRGSGNQRANLVFVLALLLGWGASGVVLWQFRHLPPAWNNKALLLHDLLTWVGVPYAIYHAVSRSRWLKRQQRLDQAAATARPPAQSAVKTSDAVDMAAVQQPVAVAGPTTERTAAQAVIAALKESSITRASFLRLAAGLLLVIAVGPAFYSWVKGAFDTSGETTAEVAALDGNSMLPPPAPLPDSAAVVGGGTKGNFRIYTVTDIPTFSSDTWKFAVSGLVDRPSALSWEQFLKLERVVQVSDFHCVTGWSVYKCTWEGIPLKQLLAAAGVQSSAKFVKFYSGDRVYTDALSLDQAGMDDVLVAVLMDGKPIPQKLGGPVRLVVPQMYAYKSVKWLQGIELIDKPHMGYWEVRGYDNDAWVNRA